MMPKWLSNKLTKLNSIKIINQINQTMIQIHHHLTNHQYQIIMKRKKKIKKLKRKRMRVIGLMKKVIRVGKQTRYKRDREMDRHLKDHHLHTYIEKCELGADCIPLVMVHHLEDHNSFHLLMQDKVVLLLEVGLHQ